MNNPEELQTGAGKGRPRLVIIVIVLIFSAPLLSSWFILNYTDYISTGGASHGDLYDPLVSLPDVSLFDPLAEDSDASLHGKWSLLYISSGPCDQECDYRLYSMRQIRLAVSRYARHLQRVWMTGLGTEQVRKALQEYEGTLFLPMDVNDPPLPLEQFAVPPIDEVLQADCLYVVDPAGNLVLRYRPGVEPEGIISDLKRLLKTTRLD